MSSFVRRVLCGVLCSSIVIMVGCSTLKGGQVQEQLGLLDVFGLEEGDGWSLLTNPDSIWQVGSVMVFANSGKPDWETNIDEDPFLCIPKEFWKVKPSSTPQFIREKSVNYNFNLTKTLGVSEADLAAAGLNEADEGEPNYKSTISLTDVAVKRLNRGAAKKYISENYGNISDECHDYINSANSYIIGETYAIKDGTIKIERNNGFSVDLTVLEDSLKTGYKVTSNDTISMSGKEIVVAIRPADFTEALLNAGVEPKRKSDNLDERLVKTKEAIVVDGGWNPNYWTLGAIVASTLLILSAVDGGGSAVPPSTTPVILNLTLPPAE